MQIVGDFVVIVEIREYQDRQIEPRVEEPKLRFLQLTASFLHLQFRLDDIGMSHFAAIFEFLRKLEEALAFLRCSLRGLELQLGGGSRVIILYNGHDQASGSNLRPRPRSSRGSRRPAKIREASKIKRFMNIRLAYVFMNGVIRNETYCVT